MWGIGQIGATLVWAPLLIEMSYSAFRTVLQQRQQGKPNDTSETNVVMQNLEDGQFQGANANAAPSMGEPIEPDRTGREMLLSSTNTCQRFNVLSPAAGLDRRNTG